jgi:hypothetical protein
MQIKLAPQVMQLLAVKIAPETNLVLAQLWRQVRQERAVEQSLKPRATLDGPTAAPTTSKRVRFNYD